MALRETSILTVLSSALLRAAGICQNLEHIGEGTAVGGLGDEAALAAEEDEEGDANADGGDGVAAHEAHVLLHVGRAPQREDRAQVNAPVKPIKEPSCGFWASVFNLKQPAGDRWESV